MKSPFRVSAVAMWVLLASPVFAYYPQWSRTSTLSFYTYPHSVASADFNEDSMPDVVVRSGNRVFISVLSEARALTPGGYEYSGTTLKDVEVGDFNGDGAADLLVSDAGTSTLVAIAGNGDGTFDPPVVTNLPAVPGEIALGDFDENGSLDAIVVSGNALTVWLGNGAGGFSEGNDVSLSAPPANLIAEDVDGDANLDVVALTFEPVALVLLYGIGDGTFAPPATLAASAMTTRISVGDLDLDGDREIIACQFPDNTISVHVNNGSRTFAPETVYVAITDPTFGNPRDIAIFDVTEDGRPDVVVTLANKKVLATFRGNGNGLLDPPTLRWVPGTGNGWDFLPGLVTTADFSGDGRSDLAITSSTGFVSLMENRAGASRFTLYANPWRPTVTSGQSLGFKVLLVGENGDTYGFGSSTVPYPTGALELRSGDTVLTTGAFEGYEATFDITSPPVGVHSITARFAGDDNFRPSVTSPLTQTVVSESTSVTLWSNTPVEVPYGTELELRGTVTSPIAGSLDGGSTLYRNGEAEAASGAPDAGWLVGPFSPGRHEFHATYGGNATQPPSGASNTVTHIITKADPLFAFENSSALVFAGATSQVRVYLGGPFQADRPRGTVRLFEGSTVLDTVVVGAVATGDVYFDIPVLPAGDHLLHATYGGDANYNARLTPLFNYRVAPAVPIFVNVSVIPNGVEAMGMHAATGRTNYAIHRRVGVGPWSSVWSGFPVDSQYSVPTGRVYSYRMEVLDATYTPVVSSGIDLAMPYPFTDQPLARQMPVKAVHVSELVEATNLLRTTAGLPPITLSEISAGKAVKASQIIALRNAIQEARAAFGAYAVTFQEAIGPGAPIRASHIQELRNAMQ